MRVSIIREDNSVTVDGVALAIDCTDLWAMIHAIQWKDNEGEIEFVPDADGRRMANLKIYAMTQFQYLVDRFNIERERLHVEAEKKKRADEEKTREVSEEVAAIQSIRKPKTIDQVRSKGKK